MEFNYIMKNKNGSVNVDGTVEAYREALELWVAEKEAASLAMRKEVDMVLALAALGSKPKRVSMEELAGMVAVKMSPKTTTEWSAITKAVKVYVTEHSGGIDSDARYCGTTGRGGGYTFTNQELARRAMAEAEAEPEANTPPSEMDE